MSTTVLPSIEQGAEAPAVVRDARRETIPPITLGTVVGVELRKMFDTRSGFWLMMSIGILSVVATGATILFAPDDALTYGIFAIYLLIRPGDAGPFLDRWIVAIGLAIVTVSGLLYLVLARPDQHSDHVPQGDAREVAAHLRQIRQQSGAGRAPRPDSTVPSEEIR